MTPEEEDRCEKDFDQKKLEFFQTFVKNLEELFHTHPGSLEKIQINHVNVITSHFGWQEYMAETWHKHTPNGKESEEITFHQTGNLFEAGFEPFHLYFLNENIYQDKEWRPVGWLIKCVSWIPPHGLWTNFFIPQKPLSRWEGFKLDLACLLLNKIYYYHR